MKNNPRWSSTVGIIGSVLLAAVTFAQEAPSGNPPSYGELAGQMLCGPMDEIHAGLTNFTVTTLPHQAKELRKLLGKFRNRLDLFAFAYPTGPGKDPFRKLREDIDDGYEDMGDFKDLFDAQGLELAKYDPVKRKWSKGIRPEAVRYTDHERIAIRRAKVLKWKAKFLEVDRQAKYRAFVCAPDLERFHKRSAKKLSRFFWGSEKGLMPRHDLSGIDNFRWLAAELLDRALQDYPEVQILRSLEGPPAEKFHDFRKRVRAVVKITEDISLLPQDNERATELYDLMDDLDDGYGDINDKIVDVELAVESGDIAKATRRRTQITTEWAELRQWQMENSVTIRMTEFIELLRSLMAIGN